MMRYLILLLGFVLVSCADAPESNSKIDHTGSPDIHLNQIGFYPDARKIAIVPEGSGEDFRVVDVVSGDTALTAIVSNAYYWNASESSVRQVDFSELTIPGTYRLVDTDGTVSYTFRVAENVHRDVAKALVKGFYFQRTAIPLETAYAGQWARPAGHPDTVVYVHSSAATETRPERTVIPSPRGWYDAGDYNKYIINSGISTYQLLAIYEHFPEFAERFDLNIPESDGALPDILAEAWWNIDWMRTMQDPDDGGVYHKLTTAEFEGYIRPEDGVDTRYVIQKSITVTLDFAAVLAQASRIWRTYDAALADSLLAQAIYAWEWAVENPEALYNQNTMNERFEPAILTGAYGDGNADDEFTWAAAELFVTTGDARFLDHPKVDFEQPFDVPAWPHVRALAAYTLLEFRDDVEDIVPIEPIRTNLITLADELYDRWNASPYGTSMLIHDFVWGSTAVAANQAMVLIQTYRHTGEDHYLDAALGNLDFLLGRNPTGFSFVTGYGHHTPMHIHHRPSESDDVVDPVPGLIAGGPNPFMQDADYCITYGAEYSSDVPALAYLDHVCSYASNEIAINWNSAAAYVAVALEALKESD